MDVYIARSQPFARPILEHLRACVHAACPKTEETIKWGFPHFDYEGMLCSMAAFKAHCAFLFWKASLLSASDKLAKNGEEAMGHLGRITSVADLPSQKVLKGYIKEAMRLNEQGVAVKRPARAQASKKVELPAAFAKALRAKAKAFSAFEAMSPSHKREYIAWITEAKKDETRERRIATAVTQIAEGKSLNWKYERR